MNDNAVSIPVGHDRAIGVDAAETDQPGAGNP
jgi:hypothetical protein